MAKCKDCGRGWFFFKVLPSGICQKCEDLAKLEEIAHNVELFKDEERRIKSSLNVSKRELSQKIESLQLEEKRLLYSVEETRKEVLKNIEQLKAEEEKAEASFAPIVKKLVKLRSFYKAIEYSITRQHTHYGEYNDKEIIENVQIAEEILSLSPSVKLKLHCMDTRELKKAFHKNEQTIKKILEEYKSRYTTKANATIYALMVIALEAELQNVLHNLRYAKLDESLGDIKKIILKYQKIASEGNQNIAPTVARFIGEIEYLFLEAIKIEYEYYIQKERIKEEQKMLKEQMRQEALEQKALEEQRNKVEQEEAKFLAELRHIENLLTQSADCEKTRQLQERFNKVELQLTEVERNKEEIVKLQNGKAGYVYIISNFGSFGNNIFKIGMTRRLNPQDRVDELGNASVPFRFDVHSFIFSESAPELETSIHKLLHEKRVNKVNLRKEFFFCSIEELEEIVYRLEPTASFNRTMLAEQYYQGMAVEHIPHSLELDSNADDDEEKEED